MSPISILYIILALFIFGILIFIHELGHYLTARAFDVTVHEFAIGMGPKIFTKVSPKTGIAYSLRLFPIGGFVAMEGEDAQSDDANAFHRKSVWQRIIITCAGAAMNLIVGILVMFVLVACQEYLPSTEVALFVHDDTGYCYAEAAGLQIGDRITEIDGTRVSIADELVYEVMRKGVEPIDVTVLRSGQRIVLSDVEFPVFSAQGTRFGTIDFKVSVENKNVLTVLKHAVLRSSSTIKMIWESLYDLVTGRYGAEAVSGPIGVTQALGEAAEESTADLIHLAVVISMNLGVMNLLPLPALDGGRLLFQLIELIRRKPVDPNLEGYVHFAGLVLLMILMVVIAFKDIAALF